MEKPFSRFFPNYKEKTNESITIQAKANIAINRTLLVGTETARLREIARKANHY